MQISKVSLILNCRDQDGDDIKTTVGYINPAIYNGTDEEVTAKKSALRTLAVGLNNLTSNTLDTVTLETLEDITTAGV